MNQQTFLSEFARLVADHGRAAPNLACITTTDSAACVDCVFCTGCERCYSARYSTDCQDSFDITHCSACIRCYACTFCQHSRGCVYSNYLIHCVDCIRCDYCFGCVGLEKQYFHILNRKYARKDYFAIVKQLQASITSALEATFSGTG